MRWGQKVPSLLVAALLCCAGCPPAADVKQSAATTMSAESMPTAPDQLTQLADEQFQKGGAGVDNSRVAMERAIAKNPEWAQAKTGHAAYFRLARAYTDLAATTSDSAKKGVLSEAGIAAGRKAVEQEPDKVEGPYYLAQLIGYGAQVNKGESKEAVKEMVRLLEQADKIDEAFDHGGPARVLGAVYAKAPEPPLSVGDPVKAVKLLRKATQTDSAYPANLIYLADALIADENYAEAEATLKSAREMLADKRWNRDRAPWTDELNKVQKKLRAKQG